MSASISNRRVPLAPSTVALHARATTGPGRALGGSIVQSSSFTQQAVGDSPAHAYSRVSNPTVSDLEFALGALENAPPAVCFSSGLAAETALFLTLLSKGDHAVVSTAAYGGTVRLFNRVLAKYGIDATFVDATDAALVKAAINDRTKIVFVETPANPTLDLVDLSAVAKVCKERGVPLAVDNTFLTAAIQKPLDLGADISVYSTTKHIEGHSAAVGGAIVARDAELLTQLRFIRKCTGGIQTPFNAYLTLRGVETLPLRSRQHSRGAGVVASWLAKQPSVALIRYPGLDSHPQRALAIRQHGGFHGGVICFELRGGLPAARTFLSRLQLVSLAEHVGGAQTILTHPATMTHGDVPPAHRHAVGITDGLLRLSVGLEDPSDIIADLSQALDAGREASAVRLEEQAARLHTAEASEGTLVGGLGTEDSARRTVVLAAGGAL
ncbi:MAG: trans-sulfuration enzyme family protein [Phycisphaerales bacterium]